MRVLGYEKFIITTLSNARQGGDGEGLSEVGLKSLNPSPSRLMVWG